MNRKIAVAVACLSIAALPACSVTTPPVPPVVSTVPAQNLTIAEKVQLVADALGNVLPKLGVTDPRIAQGLNIVDQLTALAGQIKLSGGNVSDLAIQAADMIGTLAPLLDLIAGPYAPVIDAAVAIIPEILQLAGVSQPATGSLAPPAMTPAQAEAILHKAAGY